MASGLCWPAGWAWQQVTLPRGWVRNRGPVCSGPVVRAWVLESVRPPPFPPPLLVSGVTSPSPPGAAPPLCSLCPGPPPCPPPDSPRGTPAQGAQPGGTVGLLPPSFSGWRWGASTHEVFHRHILRRNCILNPDLGRQVLSLVVTIARCSVFLEGGFAESFS